MFCLPLQTPLQPSLALSAQKTSPGLEEILLQTLLLGARGSCHSRRLQEGKCVRGDSEAMGYLLVPLLSGGLCPSSEGHVLSRQPYLHACFWTLEIPPLTSTLQAQK